MSEDTVVGNPELEYEKWSVQIRRGALSMAILAIILDGESYGYDIMKKLGQEEYVALQVEPSTTYPLLRRLEARGILEGKWSDTSGKRRRLYYVTRGGRLILRQMVTAWRSLNDQLMQLVKEAGLE
ncbi:MAG: PadR family transcriptional regulator [Candidatus Thorarchaeota archaeon]|nr:PadR family transcriptional regulator [Candidatus Thorarchaeota archaeon]